MPEGNLPSEEEINRGKEAVDVLTQLSEILLQNLNINRENTDAIKDSVSNARDLASPFKLSAEAAKEINKASRDSSRFLANIVAQEEKRSNLLRTSKDIGKDLSKGEDVQNKLIAERKAIQLLQMDAMKAGRAEEAAAFADLNKGLQAQISQQRDIEASLKKELESAEKIEDSFGLAGGALKTVNKLLDGAIPGMDNVLKKSREQIATLEKESKLRDGLPGKVQGLGILTKNLGGAIKANMLDPLTLIKAGFDFDAEATKLQKNLGLSSTEAYGLNVQISAAATATGNMAIQGSDAAKAFGTLNDQIGVASTSLIGMAGEAAKMQKLLGLSDEAIGRAGKASLILGKSMENIKLDIIDQTTAVRSQTGIALDYNKILEKTLNVSGQIAAQLGNNPKLIAAAVAQANALGMELEQVAKVGESLLNFEQSIEAELQAELLTGKELNLEKARLLALTGDYEALSREIAEQAGTFTEYSAMNVIQQQKLAEAFGMSADEMSNMLIDQEALGKTAEQLRAEGKEDIAQRLEARDAQQQFTDAVEKMKSIFVDLVGGPVGALLNMLTLALEPINIMITGVSKLFGLLTGSTKELGAMEAIFGGIATVVGVVAGAMKLNAMYTSAMGVSTGIIAVMKERGLMATIKEGPKLAFNAAKSLMQAVAKMMGMGAQTLGLSIALGLAAGAATYAMVKADDAIIPGSGGGYGKRALLDEGSVTLFNDKDTILAGTNLNKADDMVSSPAGTVQTAPSPTPAPIILKNEVVYDSHQSANYYNGPRSTEKSETGIHV